MGNDVERYSDFKAVQLLTFTSNENGILYKNYWQQFIFSDSLLDAIKYFVILNYDNKILEPATKNNLLGVISYIRNNRQYQNKAEKHRLYELYNYLISTLNRSESVNYYDFYVDELIKRNDFPKLAKIIKNISRSYIDSIKKEICVSISNDFAVLANHSPMVDDIEFLSLCKEYATNHYYLDSINAIIKECPLAVLEQKFLVRMLFVLENSKKLMENEESYFDKDTSITYDKYIINRTDKMLKKAKIINKKK